MDKISIKTPDNRNVQISGNYDKNDKTIFYGDNGKAYRLSNNKWNEFKPDTKIELKKDYPNQIIDKKNELLGMQTSTQNISPQEAELYNKQGGIIMRGGTDVGNQLSTVKGIPRLDEDKQKPVKDKGIGAELPTEKDIPTLTLPQELINLYLQKAQGVDQPVEFRTYKPIELGADLLSTAVKGLSEGLAREVQKKVSSEIGKIDAMNTIKEFEKLTGKKFTKDGIITPSKTGLTYEQQKLLEETQNLIPQREQLSKEQLEAQQKYYELMRRLQGTQGNNQETPIVNQILKAM